MMTEVSPSQGVQLDEIDLSEVGGFPELSSSPTKAGGLPPISDSPSQRSYNAPAGLATLLTEPFHKPSSRTPSGRSVVLPHIGLPPKKERGQSGNVILKKPKRKKDSARKSDNGEVFSGRVEEERRRIEATEANLEMLRRNRFECDSLLLECWLNDALVEMETKDSPKSDRMSLQDGVKGLPPIPAAPLEAAQGQLFQVNPAALCGLSRFGLSRLELGQAGLGTQTIERVYRSLYVYTVGFHDTLKDLFSHSGDRMALVSNVWRSFLTISEKNLKLNYKSDWLHVLKEHEGMETDMNLLRERIQVLTGTVGELDDKLQRAVKKIAQDQVTITSLQQERGLKEQRISDEQAGHTHAVRKFVEEAEHRSHVQEELIGSRKNLLDVKREADEARQELAHWRQENGIVKEERDKFKKEVSDLKAKLEKEVQAAKEAAKKFKQDLEASQTACKVAESSQGYMEKRVREEARARVMLAGDVHSKKEKIQALMAEIDDLKFHIDGQAKRMVVLEVEPNRLTKELKEVTKRLEEAHEIRIKLMREVSDLKEQLAKFDNKQKQWKKVSKSLQLEAKQRENRLADTIKSVNQEKEVLLEEMKKSKAAIEANERRLEVLAGAHRHLGVGLALALQEVWKGPEALKAKDEKIAQEQYKKKELMKQINDLVDQHATLEAEMEKKLLESQAKAEKAQADLATVKSQLIPFQEEMRKEKMAHSKVIKERDAVKKDLMENNARYIEMKERLQQWEANESARLEEAMNSSSKMKHLESQVQELTEQLAKEEQEHFKTQDQLQSEVSERMNLTEKLQVQTNLFHEEEMAHEKTRAALTEMQDQAGAAGGEAALLREKLAKLEADLENWRSQATLAQTELETTKAELVTTSESLQLAQSEGWKCFLEIKRLAYDKMGLQKDLKGVKDELDGTTAKLEAEVEDLKKQILDVKDEKAQAEAETASIKTQLEQEQMENQTRAEKITALEVDLQLEQNKVDEVKRSLAELEQTQFESENKFRADIANYMVRIGGLEEEIKRLKQKMAEASEAAEKGTDEKNRQIIAMQLEFEDQLAAKQRELEAQREEMNRISADFVRQMSEENKKAESNSAEHTANMKAKDHEILQLHMRAETLSYELAETQQTVQVKDKELNEKQDQIIKLTARVDELEKIEDSLQNRLLDLQEAKERGEQEAREREAELQREIKELTTQVAELDYRVGELESQIEREQEAAKALLESTQADAQAAAEKAKEEYEALLKAKGEVEEQLQLEKRAHEESIGKGHRESEALQSVLNKLREDVSTGATMGAAAEAKIQELEIKYEMLEIEHQRVQDELNAQINQANEKISQMTSEISQLEADKVRMEDAALVMKNNIQAKVDEAINENRELQANMEKQLAEKEQEIKELKESHEKFLEELNELHAEAERTMTQRHEAHIHRLIQDREMEGLRHAEEMDKLKLDFQGELDKKKRMSQDQAALLHVEIQDREEKIESLEAKMVLDHEFLLSEQQRIRDLEKDIEQLMEAKNRETADHNQMMKKSNNLARWLRAMPATKSNTVIYVKDKNTFLRNMGTVSYIKIDFTADTLRKFAMQIYCEKMISDAVDYTDNIQTQTIEEFTYDFLLNKFGLQTITETHLRSLVESIRSFSVLPRVSLFGRLIGIPSEYGNIPEDMIRESNAFFINLLTHIHSRTEGPLPSEIYEGRSSISFGVAKEAVDRAFPNSPTRAKQVHAAVARILPEGADAVDLDTVLGYIMKGWDEEVMANEEQIHNFFVEGDLDRDGVLNVNEFTEIVAKVAPHVPKNSHRGLFREALRMSDSPNRITPNAFAKVMRANGLHAMEPIEPHPEAGSWKLAFDDFNFLNESWKVVREKVRLVIEEIQGESTGGNAGKDLHRQMEGFDELLEARTNADAAWQLYRRILVTYSCHLSRIESSYREMHVADMQRKRLSSRQHIDEAKHNNVKRLVYSPSSQGLLR